MYDLPFVAPSALSLAAFLAVVTFVVLSGVGAVRAIGADAARQGRVAAGFAGWLALTAAIPASGVLGVGPPLMMGFLAGCLLAATGFALSRLGGELARGLPLWALIGFQAFRLPLEIVLHQWHAEGTIPVEMTWSGQNLDVVTGVVSLLAAGWLWLRPDDRVAFGLSTAVGSLLLANVVRVAMMCAPVPLPFHVDTDPPLLLALYAPYAWIVSICVAGALVGHLLAIRRLRGG